MSTQPKEQRDGSPCTVWGSDRWTCPSFLPSFLWSVQTPSVHLPLCHFCAFVQLPESQSVARSSSLPLLFGREAQSKVEMRFSLQDDPSTKSQGCANRFSPEGLVPKLVVVQQPQNQTDGSHCISVRVGSWQLSTSFSLARHCSYFQILLPFFIFMEDENHCVHLSYHSTETRSLPRLPRNELLRLRPNGISHSPIRVWLSENLDLFLFRFFLLPVLYPDVLLLRLSLSVFLPVVQTIYPRKLASGH